MAGRSLKPDELKQITRTNRFPGFIKDHPDIPYEAALERIGIVFPASRRHVSETNQ